MPRSLRHAGPAGESCLIHAGRLAASCARSGTLDPGECGTTVPDQATPKARTGTDIRGDEAAFRASRMATQAQINVTTYPQSAALIMLFSWWDWFVDPANWKTALAIRSIGALVVIATGLVQHFSRRIDWAAAIAGVRYTAGVLAVAGDRMIRAIGARLRAELRETDAFGRWGGEEFIAILPGTEIAQAQLLGERMRAAIESGPAADRAELRVSVSLGIAGRPAGGTWDTLVKAADEALYRAKALGRNCVALATGANTVSSSRP
jgi:hypothetical protein